MDIKKRRKESALWLGLALLMGALGGLVGAGFSLAVAGVTVVRHDHAWLLYLLPVAGVLSVAVTKGLKADGFGATEMLRCANDSSKTVPPNVTVSVFVGAVLTHLFGGSAGKEGAALQIGGGLAALVNKWLGLDPKRQRTLLLCAMAALFAAAFGTPLTAAVFVMEAARLKRERLWELLPCGIASLVGFVTANLLGAEPERFALSAVEPFGIKTGAVLLGAAVCAALLGEGFCFSLRVAGQKAKAWFPNPYLRIALGGVLVVLTTLAIGTRDYNGSSLATLHTIFAEGQVAYEAFALKFLLTVITVSVGFKGGQIVPSLFIGAAVGGALGLCFGVSVPLAAAVGLAAFFCAVTNCTAASLLLALEVFSGHAFVYLAAAVMLARLISGKISLYGDAPLRLKKEGNRS